MRHVCHIICCYIVAFISGEKQIEIRSNCGFRNCEFFGVNIRNELLKSLILKEIRSSI